MTLKIRIDADRDWNRLWHEEQARKIITVELAPPVANMSEAHFPSYCGWGCGTRGWARMGATYMCEECKAKKAEPEEPQEMVVKHVVEHVRTTDFTKDIVLQ